MFRILLVSDIHCALEKIALLSSRVRPEEYDVVLCLGDLANFQNTGDEQEAVFDGSQVVAALDAQFDKAVLWIPGNHDPLATFAERPRGFAGVALHNRYHELAPGLCVLGYGGAVPGYANGYEVWSGYPFTEQQMGDALEALLAQEAPADQVLLATHCGPFDVSTSIDTRSDDVVQSGSTNLRRVIKAHQFVATVHGHTHAGWGTAQLGPTPVINPGSLKEGRYGMLHLRRDSTSQRWSIEKVEHAHLME